MSTYPMSLEAARHEMSRRLRDADDERQRRLARRSFRRTRRAGAGTMCR
ncbi:MAG TPA: hypothetical protein VFT70_09900 [Nocardioides sp.]|nr:hypothetical protein [Nocardioides sp.]